MKKKVFDFVCDLFFSALLLIPFYGFLYLLGQLMEFVL